MKQLFSIIFFTASVSAFAQLDLPNNSVKLNSTNPLESPSSFEIPESKAPTLSKSKTLFSETNSDFGKPSEQKFDMQKGDGLMDYTGTNKTPKYFTKDKEAKAEYGKDMYLGDIKTDSKYVTIQYRDHEYVDGDRVRIFVNGDMVMSNVMLEGSFRGFNLPLQDGFNKIDFQALNQGSSGPNTAQLQILDEVGNILASYEWNLLTGNKATAIVVKP